MKTREEAALEAIDIVLKQIAGMVEFMAEELDRRHDHHGAEVIRFFGSTMMQSFDIVKGKHKVTLQ